MPLFSNAVGLGLLSALWGTANANPLQYLRETNVLKRQNVRQQPPSIPPAIFTPTITIFVVFFSLALLAVLSRIILRRMRQNARNSNAGPTELTADQLAGTINGAPGTGNSGARRPRRSRRPRRTPSQMSVTSLPEYNKEPGAEEVVIFRAQSRDPLPGSIVVESIDEEREDEDFQRYSPVSGSQTSVPLLHEDETGDNSERSMQIPTENLRRQSTGSGSNDTSSLDRLDTPEPAPAYFEVVGDEVPIYPPSIAHSSSPPPPERPVHQSGFRTLLNRMSIHQRGDSGNAALLSSARSGTHSQHRQTPSTSSSFLNSFRPLSRQRSTHTVNSDRMNSPSLISLTSISAPLTHTAVRTDFTYPKTGPTAEQLKIIASRESIGKFGVPYGPAAIAFAASTSWHDLLPPPPGFEEVDELPPHPSPGPSGLRSSVILEAESSTEPAGSPSRIVVITVSSSAPNGNAESVIAANNSSTQERNNESLSENVLQASTLSRDTQTLSIPIHIPSSNVVRSDSIASISSNVTYVTATGSFDSSSAPSSITESGGVDEDNHLVEAPTTPMFTVIRGHEAEPTDVTITLANAGA